MTDTTLTEKRREHILKQIPSLPPLPTAAVKVRELLREPNPDFDEIADAIRYDQAITANLLKIANTVAFGGRRQVTTVKQTLVRLGTKRVSQIVMGVAAAPLLKSEVEGYDLGPEQLWKHAMAVGIGSEELAKKQETNAAEVAFTAGLLHDIGKIALGTFIDADGDEIKSQAFDKGLSFQKAEQNVLGIDHAEVGARLLDHWDLPEEHVQVVRWHHEPDQASENASVADLVHVAELVCMQGGIGAGTDGLHYRHSAEAVQRLELNRDMAEALLLDIETTLEEMSGLFDAS